MPTEFNPQKEFQFYPPAAPAVVSELGLQDVQVVGLELHEQPFLDKKMFPQAREYQLIVCPKGASKTDSSTWRPAKDIKVVYAYGYWIVSRKGFMYIEAIPGKGDFLGAIDLARIQASMTRELFEIEGGSKVFLPHMALVNYASIPRPGAGTVVAGIITAAHRVLKGGHNGLLLAEAFCETEEMLFSSKRPDNSGRRSIKNFIRLGSNLDAIFINPLEHEQDPSSALAYLKQKYAKALENMEHRE